MVPIDKASNNLAFMQKMLCLTVIFQELGTSTNEPLSTYKINQINSKQKLELDNFFCITVKDDIHCLTLATQTTQISD